MALNCGIVGLPNVGKSTIFTALSASQAECANYPFCTIEPQVGVAIVPDARLDNLVKIFKPQRKIGATVEFVDIAGLVKGASKGEGLGNQFLAHIREVGLLAHVVRCFDDDDIVHVEGRVDPLSDIETVNTELALADLQTLEKSRARAERALKVGGADKKGAELLLAALSCAEAALNAGRFARTAALEDAEREALRETQFITMKKVLYVCNVGEDFFKGGATRGAGLEVEAVKKFAEGEGAQCVAICGGLEADLVGIKDPVEKNLFLNDAGLEEEGLSRLIRAAYAEMGLATFFTAGADECRAWTVRAGALAPQAAGVIHSDFEKGFIKAEVYSYDDLLRFGGEAGVREAGRYRLEGRDYAVQDGDVMFFKFNP